MVAKAAREVLEKEEVRVAGDGASAAANEEPVMAAVAAARLATAMVVVQ